MTSLLAKCGVILNTHLESKGIQVEDFIAYSTDSVDYPDFVRPAAEAVARNSNTRGIIISGSENEAIVADRIRGVRCAVVWSEQTARRSKEHGSCNMIAVGQRLPSKSEAISIVDAWLSAEFKDRRHQKRIDKIDIK
jgi:ribose 5-phosphate isomerase B